MSLFSAIGDAVSSVVDVVTDVADVVLDATGLDEVINTLGLDELMMGSVGGFINNLMDELGLPDVVGDFVGTIVDLGMGNALGATANFVDGLEDVAEAVGISDVLEDIVGEGLADLGLDKGLGMAGEEFIEWIV